MTLWRLETRFVCPQAQGKEKVVHVKKSKNASFGPFRLKKQKKKISFSAHEGQTGFSSRRTKLTFASQIFSFDTFELEMDRALNFESGSSFSRLLFEVFRQASNFETQLMLG